MAIEEDDIWHLLTPEERARATLLRRQATQRHLITALGDFALYCRALNAGATRSSSSSKPPQKALQLPPLAPKDLRNALAITDKATVELLISMAQMKKDKNLGPSARFFVDRSDASRAQCARSRGLQKTPWGDDLSWPFQSIGAFARLENGLRIQTRKTRPCVVLTLRVMRDLEHLVHECSFGRFGEKDWASRLYGEYWPLAVHYLCALEELLNARPRNTSCAKTINEMVREYIATDHVTVPEADVPVAVLLRGIPVHFAELRSSLHAMVNVAHARAEDVIDILFTSPLVDERSQVRGKLRAIVENAEADRIAQSLLAEEEQFQVKKKKKGKRKRKKQDVNAGEKPLNGDVPHEEKTSSRGSKEEMNAAIEEGEPDQAKNAEETRISETEVQEYFMSEELCNQFGMATPILEESEIGSTQTHFRPLLPWSNRLNRTLMTHHDDSRLEFVLRNGAKPGGSDGSSEEFSQRSCAAASLDDQLLFARARPPQTESKCSTPISHRVERDSIDVLDLEYEVEECALDFDALLAELEKWKNKAHCLQRELTERSQRELTERSQQAAREEAKDQDEPCNICVRRWRVFTKMLLSRCRASILHSEKRRQEEKPTEMAPAEVPTPHGSPTNATRPILRYRSLSRGDINISRPLTDANRKKHIGHPHLPIALSCPSSDASTQTAPAITLSKIYGSTVPSVVQREISRLRQENQLLRYRARVGPLPGNSGTYGGSMRQIERVRPREVGTQTQPAITLSKVWANLGLNELQKEVQRVREENQAWRELARRQSEELAAHARHGALMKNDDIARYGAYVKGEDLQHYGGTHYMSNGEEQHYGDQCVVQNDADVLSPGNYTTQFNTEDDMPKVMHYVTQFVTMDGETQYGSQCVSLDDEAPVATASTTPHSHYGSQCGSRDDEAVANTVTNTAAAHSHYSQCAREDGEACAATHSNYGSPCGAREDESHYEEPEMMSMLMKQDELGMMQLRLRNDIADLERRLTEETLATEEARDVTFRNVTRVVKNTWPRCTVRQYGSYAVGLAIPGSDMDLVITGGVSDTWQSVLSQKLADAHEHWVLSDSIKQISHTAIPILTFVAEHTAADGRRSQIHVDVSFDGPHHKGLAGLEAIAHWLELLPLLRPIVLVLKLFLHKHNLSTSYTGGLSSYGLANMVTCYLLHSKDDTLERALLGFFNFYGRQFDPRVLGVSVVRAQFVRRDGVGWTEVLPQFLKKGWGDPRYLYSEIHKFDPMFIEDPLNPMNNITRNCFRIRQIQKVFDKALESLLQDHDLSRIMSTPMHDTRPDCGKPQDSLAPVREGDNAYLPYVFKACNTLCHDNGYLPNEVPDITAYVPHVGAEQQWSSEKPFQWDSAVGYQEHHRIKKRMPWRYRRDHH